MKKIVLLSLSLFLFGCTLTSNSNLQRKTEKIPSKKYHLTNSDITINFEEDRVFGFSGVNRYFGNFSQQGEKIQIFNLATTLMMGEPEKMEIESEYLQKLRQINSFELKGDGLILTDGKTIMKFE